MLRTPSARAAVTALSVRPDQRVLAIGRGDGCVQLWDLVQGGVLAERLTRSGSPVMALSFSPDADTLCVLSEAGALTMWSGESFEPLAYVLAEPSGGLALAFSRDGAFFATTGRGGECHVWSTVTGELLWARAGQANWGAAQSVAFLDEHLVVGFESGTLGTWVRNPAHSLASPAGASNTDHERHESTAPALFVTPSAQNVLASDVGALAALGELVVVGGNHGAGILLLQGSGDWPPVARLKVPRPTAVNAVAISPTRARVAVACSDGVVRTAAFGGYVSTLCNPIELRFLQTLRASSYDQATRLTYATWLEQVGRIPEATVLRALAGSLLLSRQEQSVFRQKVDRLWEARVDPSIRPEAAEPSVLVSQTLDHEAHGTSTADSSVSSVCFIGPSWIASGHANGDLVFWPISGENVGFEGTLLIDGAHGTGTVRRLGQVTDWATFFTR